MERSTNIGGAKRHQSGVSYDHVGLAQSRTPNRYPKHGQRQCAVAERWNHLFDLPTDHEGRSGRIVGNDRLAVRVVVLVVIRSRRPLRVRIEVTSDLQQILISVALFLLVLGVAASWFLSRRMSLSVNKLVEFSRRIADGESVSEIPLRSGDELGELARHMEGMSVKFGEQLNLLSSERNHLTTILNSMTEGLDVAFEKGSRDEFDLKLYEGHIQAHIQDYSVSLRDIPPLSENLRKDLIWRFIAVIFLAHTGIVDIWQEGQEIMVMKGETNRERQDVLGELEEADGIQGSVGRVEA